MTKIQQKIPGNKLADSAADYKTGIGLTAFNLTNALLGTGIIAIPFAFREAGFGLGIILFFIFAGLADYSLILLARASEFAKKTTYAETMMAAYGHRGYILFIIIVLAHSVIGQFAINIIIGDNLSKILILFTDFDDVGNYANKQIYEMYKPVLDDLRSHVWGQRWFLILAFLLLVIFPLSLYRNIASLSKWAVVSTLGALCIVVFMAIRLAGLNLPRTPDAFKFARIDALQASGVLATGLLAHDVSLIIYQSMWKENIQRWRETVHISMSYGMAIMVAIGVLGYATFTDDTQGDVFENYCSDDVLMTIGRIMFLFTISMYAVSMLFVVRNAVEMLIHSRNKTVPYWRHLLVNIVTLAATFGLSLITDCVGIGLEINGFLTAIPMEFILPPLVMLKLRPEPLHHVSNIPLYLLLLVGVFMSVSGITVTIIELINSGAGCSAGAEPTFCLTNATNSTL